MTKLDIHTIYVDSRDEAGVRSVKLTSFKDIRAKCLPHIRIMTPRTDVCATCEDLRRKVSAAVPEPDKLQACGALTQHVHSAQRERDFYRQCSKDAHDELCSVGDLPEPPCAPCSNDLKMSHYTFDFAQNVALPHSSRQEGPLYFKTLKKVPIFGINNEGLPRQVNCLIYEIDTLQLDGKGSHGSNTVASLLHHYVEVHGLGEKERFLHADNCAGQNKNRTVVANLAWGVLTGLHEKSP